MNKYIDFGRLPITESEESDTLFGIREDGELIRCEYYIKPRIDSMFEDTISTFNSDLIKQEERLLKEIYKVRKDTVDIVGDANNRLGNI